MICSFDIHNGLDYILGWIISMICCMGDLNLGLDYLFGWIISMILGRIMYWTGLYPWYAAWVISILGKCTTMISCAKAGIGRPRRWVKTNKPSVYHKYQIWVLHVHHEQSYLMSWISDISIACTLRILNMIIKYQKFINIRYAFNLLRSVFFCTFASCF